MDKPVKIEQYARTREAMSVQSKTENSYRGLITEKHNPYVSVGVVQNRVPAIGLRQSFARGADSPVVESVRARDDALETRYFDTGTGEYHIPQFVPNSLQRGAADEWVKARLAQRPNHQHSIGKTNHPKR